MAEKDIMQDSLLREIDDELRQERYAKLWKKYGAYVIAAAVALVVAVAGYKGWQYWDQQTRMALSDRFTNALLAAGSGDADQAREAFQALAQEGSGGYALLARFQQARLLADEGKKSEALAAYRAIGDDSSVEAAYRNLALLMAGYMAVDLGSFAEVEPGITRLSQESGPWRPLAREVLALAAFQRGDSKVARDIYSELSKDAEAPSGLRTRATEMLDVLGG